MHLPDPSANDATIISSALRGETSAFEQLFDRHYPMIHSFAYRLCLRATDADDIAQETFIKAARGLPSFRGGDFRSWLYRIAANCARDFHRDAARRTRVENQACAQMLADRNARSGDEAAVSDALAGLPIEQREAVVLVYFEGLNHAEAARVLRCAETTVSWRLFRAKRKLRQLLSRSHE